MLKKILPFAVCAAIFFTSCGGNNNQSATDDTEVTDHDMDMDMDMDEDDASDSSDDVAVSQTIELTGNDAMKFDKTLFKVKAGEEVTLTLKNVGTMPVEVGGHNVVVLKQGTNVTDFGNAAAKAKDEGHIPADKKDEIIAHTKIIGPGESDQIKFTLNDAGTYTFLCSFPGHFMTMQGEIIAE